MGIIENSCDISYLSLTVHRAPVFALVGLVVRIRTIKSLDVTYVQPEIILWGAAEITTGLICVCVPPLAALAHPRHNRRQTKYLNVQSSGGRRHDGSRAKHLEEHDLFTSSDVELQYSGAAPGVAFPPPLVITDIFTEGDAYQRKIEQCKLESAGLEVSSGKAGEVSRTIGVTTTIRSERYYL